MSQEDDSANAESIDGGLKESVIPTEPCFISLIDESNIPLLIFVPAKEEKDMNEVLKYNVFSNTSIDYFESPLFDWTSLESQPSVKLFFQLEGVAVFGMLVRPTGLKIIIGFPQECYDDEENEKQIRETFQRVKQIYLRVKLNPFINTSNEDSRDRLVSKLEAKLNNEF
ncbi:TCA17 (YEL048C) [Zygosaccharomyces parabailii]|nr:TCA17 (YEL048C) [Zygosaccharomyces parabailii]CDH14001.1 related to TRAPP-associated protein TCA17 [Zygosaccharomyces bailii ISA1307]